VWVNLNICPTHSKNRKTLKPEYPLKFNSKHLLTFSSIKTLLIRFFHPGSVFTPILPFRGKVCIILQSYIPATKPPTCIQKSKKMLEADVLCQQVEFFLFVFSLLFYLPFPLNCSNMRPVS
jgi:hypothetical protein